MPTKHDHTLLGYLARHGAICGNGEPLCTLGLAYLLGDPGTGARFADLLLARTGLPVAHDLRWLAEAALTDHGRPDLEGRSADGVPRVVVEAKLKAVFGPQQLKSYAAGLQQRNPSGEGLLVVLVPRHRLPAVFAEVRRDFGVDGDAGTWRVATPGVIVTVLSWDEVLDRLTDIANGPLNHDVAQLRGMYLTLAGLDIAPIDAEAAGKWRDREADFRLVVDRATRTLTQPTGLPVYPMADEGGYLRRYVGRKIRDEWVFFSLGVRDPIVGHKTPFWLRYHADTPFFGEIERRLHELPYPVEASAGHVWIPITPDTEAVGDEIVDALVREADSIHEAIWQGV